MKNRLPLPLSAIKEIQEVLESNISNLWLKNPLKNKLIKNKTSLQKGILKL